MSSIATVLLISSGLTGLQTASIVAALPFTIILLAMTFTLYKVLKEDVSLVQQTQPQENAKKKKSTAWYGFDSKDSEVYYFAAFFCLYEW